MEQGDIQSVFIKRSGGDGAYLKAFEIEWLKYVGFTDDEIASGEIQLVFKAEKSEKRGIRYIGFGKKI